MRIASALVVLLVFVLFSGCSKFLTPKYRPVEVFNVDTSTILYYSFSNGYTIDIVRVINDHLSDLFIISATENISVNEKTKYLSNAFSGALQLGSDQKLKSEFSIPKTNSWDGYGVLKSEEFLDGDSVNLELVLKFRTNLVTNTFITNLRFKVRTGLWPDP